MEEIGTEGLGKAGPDCFVVVRRGKARYGRRGVAWHGMYW